MDQFGANKVCLYAPFSAVILGRSGSGKTTLLRDLVKHWDAYTNGKKIYRLSLIRTQEQPLFEEMLDYLPSDTIVEVYSKPPTDLDHLFRASPDGETVSLIILDDCQEFIENPKHQLFHFIMKMLSVKSHHNRVCIILTLQSSLRERNSSLLSQTNYLILTKNGCTGSLLSQVQRVLFTGEQGLVRGVCGQAFQQDDCNSLLIDFHPLQDDVRLRFRGDPIRSSPKQSLQSVYVPESLV